MKYQQYIDLIATQLSHIAEQTQSAAEQSVLASLPPEIIAVSKKQPLKKLVAALECGHRQFGENRIQEAYAHWSALKQQYTDITLHLIGPLQSNKVADAVAFFDVIHTIDREKIAQAIKHECDKQSRSISCLIQVNTGEEPQKAGVPPQEVGAFIQHCRNDIGLSIVGLMCIPPANGLPAPHFALLQKLATQHELTHLSMGMSSDYEVATRLGATYIRVGTSIFGEREI